MANTNVLTVKMVSTLLEAIDMDDEKDATQAIRMIRALLEAAEKKA